MITRPAPQSDLLAGDASGARIQALYAASKRSGKSLVSHQQVNASTG